MIDPREMYARFKAWLCRSQPPSAAPAEEYPAVPLNALDDPMTRALVDKGWMVNDWFKADPDRPHHRTIYEMPPAERVAYRAKLREDLRKAEEEDRMFDPWVLNPETGHRYYDFATDWENRSGLA
jgi:hypothetical protein